MFKLQIETGNAAFQDGDAGREVARILREIANSLEDGSQLGVARDINGNKVGQFELRHEDN